MAGVAERFIERTRERLRAEILTRSADIAPDVDPAESARVADVFAHLHGHPSPIDNLDPAIELVPPSTEVVARLAAQGIAIEPAPLVDLTLTGTNASTYGAVLTELLGSPACDAVIAVVGSSSQFRPDRAVTPISPTSPPP